MSKKYINIQEFRELGFLQEVNRQFFHPHGLALEVTQVGEEGWDQEEEDHNDWIRRISHILNDEFGDRYKINFERDRAAIRILNAIYPPNTEFISGVWDDRDDPEGVWFDWPSWNEEYWAEGEKKPHEKAEAVEAERQRHYHPRRALLDGRYSETRATRTVPVTDIEPVVWDKDGE